MRPCEPSYPCNGRKRDFPANLRAIKLWDLAAGRRIEAFTAHAGAIAALAFAPDGRLLIAGGDGTVELREAPAPTTGASADGR